jgi:hypothetical protein
MVKRQEIKAAMEDLSLASAKLLDNLLKHENIPNFPFEYQAWYTKASRAVESLAPDRIAEFRGYYQIDPKRKMMGYGTYVIQDFVKGVRPGFSDLEDFDTFAQAARCLLNQITIFEAVLGRADSILSDIEGTIYTNLQEDEIKVAKHLA